MPTYNPGSIVDKGVTYSITLWEVDDAFAIASPFVSFSLGHLSTSARIQESSKEEFKDETGAIVASTYDYAVKVTAILMETSKSIIDFMGTTVKSKRYGLTYRRDNVDGVKQEWFFAGGKVTPQFNQANPGGATSMPFEFIAYSNKSAVTLSAALLASLGCYVTVTQTITADNAWLITENA